MYRARLNRIGSLGDSVFDLCRAILCHADGDDCAAHQSADSDDFIEHPLDGPCNERETVRLSRLAHMVNRDRLTWFNSRVGCMLRLKGVSHTLEKMKPRWCSLCGPSRANGLAKKTTMMCKTCNAPLCTKVAPGYTKNCYSVWHTVKRLTAHCIPRNAPSLRTGLGQGGVPPPTFSGRRVQSSGDGSMPDVSNDDSTPPSDPAAEGVRVQESREVHDEPASARGAEPAVDGHAEPTSSRGAECAVGGRADGTQHAPPHNSSASNEHPTPPACSSSPSDDEDVIEPARPPLPVLSPSPPLRATLLAQKRPARSTLSRGARAPKISKLSLTQQQRTTRSTARREVSERAPTRTSDRLQNKQK